MMSKKFVLAVLGMVLKQIEVVDSQYQYAQWQVDPRCPEDRRLSEEPMEDATEDGTAKLRGTQPYSKGEGQAEPKGGFLDRVDIDSRELLQFVGTTNPITFNLKLYWRPGYCWQREWEERHWCLECPGTSCDEDSFLWINQCNQYSALQRFEWVQLGIDPTSYQNQGLLKVEGQNLCVEQTNYNVFQLKPCDSSNVYQKLVGFHISNAFQIRPFHVKHITECLTQDHHPKPYEELISQPCYVAQRHRTSYWEVYAPSETLVTLRIPACKANLPCNECQGDCTYDSDCRGSLRCYQRGSTNAAQSIPGCAGVPLAHYADYCYDPLRK